MTKRASFLLVLLTAAFQLAFAQTQAINGSIRGRITDPSGGPIPAASVGVVNDATGFTRDVQSGDDGYFVIPNLPLGTYTVTIKKEGFEAQKRPGVVLNAGTEAALDTQLKVGQVTTTIEVTGGAPVIEPSRVNIGRTIGHEEVDNLPLTSRNPYNFVIFQPGVSGHPNPELGIPRTINTNGLLDRINYQMDGMVNTESDRYGLRLFPISDIYVREVQTVSNSFAPEFGNTAGNIYNVITNSGTNDFHGEFYFIGRPPDASARTILLRANQQAAVIDLHDYAFNGGGPVVKNKLFVFGGYEHLLRGLPSPNTIPIASAEQAGIASSLLVTAPAVQHAQFLNLRADWVVNEKNQVFFRYNYFRNEFPFNTAVGGLNSLDVSEDFHDRAHIGGLQWLTTFSPTALNELRASEPYRNEGHVPDPLDGPGPRITITGVATFNGYGPQFTGDKFAEKIPSFSDNFTLIRSTHTYKMGFSWQENNDNQVNPFTNTYTFPNVASYLAAKNGTACPTVNAATGQPFPSNLCYSTYVTSSGGGLPYKSYFYGFYVQDSWQIRPNLVMVYGVRWDRYQGPPGEANAPFVYTRSFDTPNRDWAPRIGFAWSVNPKTVIRLNAGMFYEAPATNLWFNALNNDGIRTYTATLNPTSAGAPLFPSIVPVSGTSQSITAVSPTFKNPYTLNFNLQLARELSRNDRLELGYVRTAGRDLTFLRDMNVINPVSFLADGRGVYSSAVNASTRLFPAFNSIGLQDTGAISEYNAMIVHWVHRLSSGVSVGAAYTWSHVISDAPDANSFEQNVPIEDPVSRQRDRGNSVVNRPNAFNATVFLAPAPKLSNKVWNRLANDNQLTLLANISSGDQQNITSSVTNLNGDAAITAQRPLFIGRDALRGPSVFQIDGRYTRILFTAHEHLQVKFLAEATNIFNNRNVTALNAVVPTTSAGVPTIPAVFPPLSTVLEGRIIQLGIRADW